MDEYCEDGKIFGTYFFVKLATNSFIKIIKTRICIINHVRFNLTYLISSGFTIGWKRGQSQL